ncbi:acyltransferase family protein [Winogradskyella wichelsiae]|uniref:acyltransferase family protein n=1 Tax=Winogradskyella wichelsiae TaxID=2697007 RepID=UPI0015CAFEB2|nr:acyltransferase [Winogradskyella wichelsiae]
MHKKHTHLPWLDLIRFIAAFIVLTVHVRGYLFVEYGSLPIEEKNIFITLFYFITRLGKESVIVFFVLSGFLVGGKSIERLIKGTFNSKVYLLDRIIRLYIPLIPALILTFICGLITHFKFSFLELIGNIFSLQGVFSESFMGNAPLWSLAYEFWFYMIIFSIGIFIYSKKYRIVGFFLLFTNLIIFSILDSTFLFSWLIGALIYFLKPVKLNIGLLILSFFMIIMSIVGIQFKIETKSIDKLIFMEYIPNVKALILILSLFIGILIQQLLLIEPQKKFWKSLNKYGSKLAAFSYTLYLIHYPLLEVYKNFYGVKFNTFDIKSIGVFFFMIFICMLISYLLYLPFEKKTAYYKALISNRFIR